MVQPLSLPKSSPLSADLTEVTLSPSPSEFIESNPVIEIPQEESNENTVIREEPTGYKLPPRSTRGIPPKRYDPEYETQRSKYPIGTEDQGAMSKSIVAFNSILYWSHVPNTVEEAVKSKEWKLAIEDEISAFMKNKTWEEYEIPKGKKVVGCKWVLTIKYKSDDTIEIYKEWLVAKGYTQTYEIDYSETFSPVAKIDTIRILFSVAANKDCPLYQFDVKNAFLHGEINEEVFMQAPPGFRENFGKNEGCRLRKALYGLKQTPRAWFCKFTLAMKKFGHH